MIEGVWASDRSAGVMRQVWRCKAEQDDGLINPATPQVRWERLLSQAQRLCNEEVTAQTSKAHTGRRLINGILLDVSHCCFNSASLYVKPDEALGLFRFIAVFFLIIIVVSAVIAFVNQVLRLGYAVIMLQQNQRDKEGRWVCRF